MIEERLALTTFDLLAQAFAYPVPGMLEQLAEGWQDLPTGALKRALRRFIQEVQGLSLSEWEELYTRTLDLSPLISPYVGFQVWGDSYQRGKFLSQLNRALLYYDVDTGGELPDHLIPVLRYLSISPTPASELLEALSPALGKMQAELKKKDRTNPYRWLLLAVQHAIRRI